MSFTNCNKELTNNNKITFNEIKEIFNSFIEELENLKQLNKELFFEVQSIKIGNYMNNHYMINKIKNALHKSCEEGILDFEDVSTGLEEIYKK